MSSCRFSLKRSTDATVERAIEDILIVLVNVLLFLRGRIREINAKENIGGIRTSNKKYCTGMFNTLIPS